MKNSMANTSKKIKKMSRLALFLAMGIILNYVESLIPIPIPINGVKLGLANTLGLVILYYYSPKEYAYIGFLRVLTVGLLRTGLFSNAFFLSLGGWALSTLIAIILYYFKKFSIYGLSISSAVFHGIGQIIVSMFLFKEVGTMMVFYLPILMLSGVITGALTATVSSLVLSKFDKHVNHITNKK